ncbi:MAG: PD-(D/E)XK nuclease superfamily protein [Smithella sp. PtaU1.Bin162]|nr:MAG: PD-(D/E)XK nuclease superfamily protein [Smithella sp. PtaU1.Bin162]
MAQYLKKLIKLLRNDYPDLSAWTIICASERAVDPVQYFIHSELGGILPKIEGLNSYITKKISAKTNLQPLLGEERLLYFTRFIAESLPEETYPARRASVLLTHIAKLSEYQIGRDTIYAAERFTEDEWIRLEEYLETAEAFRKWLAGRNLFLPELETARLDEIMPAEKEIFIGLPEITPVTERFYKKVGKERFFLPKPLFGYELAGPGKLPFDSAKNLVLSFGGEVEPSKGAGIEFAKLAGLHSIVDLVTLEVSKFLKERSENDQMIIYLLDESLTAMLWNRSLRLFGNAVNLAVWLPFSTTSAGRRLLSELEKAERSSLPPDFKKFATGCAIELSGNRDNYIREECEALEAAVSFSTLLDDWKERLGRNLADTAKMLLEAKKFYIKGKMSAPVQVVGFGHVSGETFNRCLILPLDSGIMPTQPFEGPFINPVHVPQMRKSVFEYEDLVFRQILAQGDRVQIAAVEDKIRERTPSYYMSLLSQEFGKPIKATAFKESLPERQIGKKPAIPIDDDLRKRLKEFTYSFSSLMKILVCPFLFYHQYILRITPPSFMDDDEKINMQMGTFVHKFLQRLSTERKDRIDCWEGLFDELWESDENEEIRNIDGINIYMLNAKILLQEIYEDELNSGRRIVFADNAVSCEEKFRGMIAGCYKITGRSDRVARIAGHTEIIDFKYSKKQVRFNIPVRTTVLELLKEKGILHPAAQLMIYRHFNKGVEGARFYFLKEPSKDRDMVIPENLSAEADELMSAIRERLDAIIGGNELAPGYDSPECEFCLFQSLCGREGYYKAARGNN